METLKLRLADLPEISDLVVKENKIRLRAITGSMSPVIREGDLLQIESISADKLYPGDILLYRNQGQLICHRLVNKYQEMDKIYLITKADRSSIADPSFPAEQVLGRVVNIKKGSWGRYIWLCRVKPRVQSLLLQVLALRYCQWLRRFYSIAK